MRKSLFALENADDLDNGSEMETSAEEGEVADVGMDAEGDLTDIDQSADAVSDGVEAGDQLEEVEALIEDSVENGEGLSPIAAEFARISVEAICSRIGADPKSVFPLYAVENFASASSRQANSRIALEGVGEFLKDLWKRIKTALTNMWKKIKDFWAKHMSSLGRVKKALESTKTKVRASSGKFKQSAMVDKAPSAMSSAFAGKGSIDQKRVQSYIDGQKTFLASNTVVGGNISLVANLAGAANLTPADVANAYKKTANSFSTTPVLIIGGDNLIIKLEIEDDGKKITVDVEKESSQEVDADAGLLAAGREELTSLLDNTLAIIKEAIDVRKKTEKAEKDSNTALSKIEAVLAKNDGAKTGGISDDEMAALRIVLNGLYKLNAVSAKIQGICASQNVRLAKAVIGFCSASMKQYK